MRLVPSLVLALVVLLSAARADAIGVTGYLDSLETELVTRRDARALVDDKPSRKAVKQIDKSLKLLRKEKATLSVDKELKFAAKAAKLIEKKLGDEPTLLPLLDTAIEGYAADLLAARNGLAVAVSKKPNPAKLLKKADKALASFEATTKRAKQLAQLVKVAKFTDGYAPSGAAYTWVLETLTLAPANGGVDVDGDGTPDNGFAGAQDTFADLLPGDGFDIDQMVADALNAGPGVAILQMWNVDSFDGDDSVFAGLIQGMDTDDNPDDNFTGTEVFDVTGALDQDGFAPVRAPGEISAGGDYEGVFTGEQFDLAGFTFEESMRLVVEGNASETANAGSLGFAIPSAQIFTLLEDRGVDVNLLVRFAVSAVLDVDTDGDRQNDALSISFDFTAVECEIAETP